MKCVGEHARGLPEIWLKDCFLHFLVVVGKVVGRIIDNFISNSFSCYKFIIIKKNCF